MYESSADPRPAAQVKSPARLPMKEKIGWGIGGFLENMVGNSLGVMALPIFNIALGINPVLLGWAMSMPRLLDALLDPWLGSLSDNTRSRWGRRRPWVFAGAILAPLALALLFSVPPEWGKTAIFIWFAAFCSAVYILMSVFSISYGAQGFELTTDYNERTRVQAWRFVFIAVSGLLVGWLYRFALHPIFAGAVVEGVRPEVIGMRNIMWILLLPMVAAGLAPVFFGREQIEVVAQEKIGIRQGFLMTLRNPPFIIFTLLGLFTLTGGILVGPFSLYISIYHVCNGSKELAATIAGVGTIINTALSFALIPAVTHFSAKFGKRETLLLAQALLIAGSLLSWIVFTPASPWLMLSTVPFNCIALTCILILNGSIMADICDYDELKTGLRREGMYGAVAAFIGKVAFSSIGILSGYMLVWSGYVEADKQTPEAIHNMRVFFAFIPAAFGLVGLVLTLFFPLTRKKVMAVRAAIDARRAAAQSAADSPDKPAGDAA